MTDRPAWLVCHNHTGHHHPGRGSAQTALISRWTTFAAAVVGFLVLSGCGGDEPTVGPVAAPPPSAPPPTIAAAGGGGVGGRRPRVPVVEEPDAVEDAQPDLPDVPAEQLFFFRDDAPGVELIPPEVAAQENLYAVALPEAGENSRTLRIVPPEDGQGTSASVGAPSSAALPEGFEAVADGGQGGDGLPSQIRCAADGSLMVLIPGGLFLQGVEGVDANAGPAHSVELDPFYMDMAEVTLAQFAQFRSEYTPRAASAGNADDPPDHPAVGIAWRSAAAYCRWAGKELPTEAEWEKAARGPDGYLYPWGDGRVIWRRARTPNQIDPVMTFHADRSVYGVFDLAGNAREWCADNYAPDYYAREMERSGGLVENPEGPNRPAVSGHRVVRGNAPHWQLWHRSSENMSESPADVGFRGVLRISLPEQDENSEGGNGSGGPPPPTRVPTGT